MKRAPHRHHFSNRLHLGRQAAVGCRELLESEPRNFGHHVIDTWLKTGGCCAASYVVTQLIERKAHSQLGSDLSDWETGCFRCQCRRARYARVHLNHNHPTVFGIDRKLHIRAAGIDTDFTQYRQGGVTQNLVFLVRERLCGGHCNRVSGVNAHGVEVFDRAHNNAVIRFVADDFHFVLFPTQQRFFNQKLVGRRGLKPALTNRLKLFRVIGDTAARSTQGKAWANDSRKAQGFLDSPRLFHAVRDTRTGRTQSDFGHGIFELEAVFGLVNRLRRRTDQFHFVFFKNAVVPKIQGAVQRRLPAHGGKNGIWFFFGNNFLNGLPGNGFNVGDVCRGWVGHDRGRIAVDENDLVALLAQGFTGLNAGVIKLAGLSNNDRSSANDQDAFNIGTFWHFLCDSLLFFSSVHHALRIFLKLGQAGVGQLQTKPNKQSTHRTRQTGG